MDMTTQDLLFQISETIVLLRKQFFHNSGEKLQSIVGGLQCMLTQITGNYNCSKEAFSEVLEQCMEVMGEIVAAMENTDYILCADILEMQLYPLVNMLEEFEPNEKTQEDAKEVCDKDTYVLERALSGDWTIKTVQKEGFYLHSKVNPRIEAETFIDGILEIGKAAYVVWGIGLGYHIEAIYRKVGGRAIIEVYEPEESLISLAFSRGRLDMIMNDSIKIFHDPTGQKFVAAIQKKDLQIIMHYPSVRKWKEEEQKKIFQQFFISDASVKETKDLLLMNYKSNIALCNHSVDGVLQDLQKKKIVIVAAGPSLDKNVHLLKGKKNGTVVIAVGTVFGKLIRMGIIPDYVVFMDAQDRTFGQMEGLLDLQLQVPIIVESTACWKFIRYYQGPKMIAYQKGYELAEEKAEKEGTVLFETGGTVTSLAIDIAIKGGASEIICIGMDLAYTGGATHAEGTMDRGKAEETEVVEVDGYYGDKIYTKLIFNMYREWIEKRIQNCKETTFVNATEGGVYVKGMLHEPLERWI